MARQEKSDALTWEDLRRHALWWVGLFHRAFGFFAGVWRRHRWASLAGMSLGVTLLIGMLYLRAGEYRMTTTIVYGELHPKIFGDMVAKLNGLLKNQRQDKAAELMQLSREQVEKIRSVKITDIKGKTLVTNYTFRKEPLLLTIGLSAPIDEDTLRRAVLHYFNGNPFTADRLELKKRLLLEERDYIDRKLETIDSILSNLYIRRKSGVRDGQSTINIETSEEKNAYELLSFSRDLLHRKGEIENNLVNPENVIAIDNFLILPRERMSAGAIVKYGVAGAVMGFLAVSFLFFWAEVLRPQIG